jgi:V/A-type H+-transporting ATPase subunit K
MEILGYIGFAASLALAATGSALGTGAAGMAAVGAWKKCFAQNKPAPFMLIVFVGAPFTQTLYGMLLMGEIQRAPDNPEMLVMKLGAGVLGGMAMGFSAWLQGKAGAAASDALAETGKGLFNYILVLGIIESVALFTYIFMMGALNQ